MPTATYHEARKIYDEITQEATKTFKEASKIFIASVKDYDKAIQPFYKKVQEITKAIPEVSAEEKEAMKTKLNEASKLFHDMTAKAQDVFLPLIDQYTPILMDFQKATEEAREMFFATVNKE